MDLTAIFSNDQLAVAGCFLALASCGLIAAVTFHVGPAGKKSADSDGTRHLRLPDTSERDEEKKRRTAA